MRPSAACRRRKRRVSSSIILGREMTRHHRRAVGSRPARLGDRPQLRSNCRWPPAEYRRRRGWHGRPSVPVGGIGLRGRAERLLRPSGLRRRPGRPTPAHRLRTVYAHDGVELLTSRLGACEKAINIHQLTCTPSAPMMQTASHVVVLHERRPLHLTGSASAGRAAPPRPKGRSSRAAARIAPCPQAPLRRTRKACARLTARSVTAILAPSPGAGSAPSGTCSSLMLAHLRPRAPLPGFAVGLYRRRPAAGAIAERPVAVVAAHAALNVWPAGYHADDGGLRWRRAAHQGSPSQTPRTPHDNMQPAPVMRPWGTAVCERRRQPSASTRCR